MDAQVRCFRCGHVPLLLLVFGEGLIQRARVGCSCASSRLHYRETERILHDRNELISILQARSGTHTDSRASLRAAPDLRSFNGRSAGCNFASVNRAESPSPLAKKHC